MRGKQRPVSFQSSGLRIDAIFIDGERSKRPVLLCAPHPLYGGNMHNELIVTVADALSGMKHPVLRFDYRGSGRSEGSYAGGKGEAEDTCSAADFLLEETGSARVMVCAYSFGAWVTMLCRQKRDDLSPVVLVSPPNRMMDFDFGRKDSDIYILAGTHDDYCDTQLLEKQFSDRISLIDGADHFYTSGLDDLTRQVCKIAADILQ